MKEFQPVSACHCGAMKDWINDHNQECSMQFLMGLNDSYAQNRAQILMMDPLPVISKIFALVMQEERQRSIHNDVPVSSVDRSVILPSSSMIAAAKGQFAGNKGAKLDNRPICSHSNITGHTVDKCYKVHGYPPGHPKFKLKQHDYKPLVNQVRAGPPSSCDISDKLSSDQCKQLITLLSSQLQLGYGSHSDGQQLESSVSCFSGTYNEQDDWDG